MKWRSYAGELEDEQSRKKRLEGVYRKHFALLPTDVGGHTVWLEYYYKVYKWQHDRPISKGGTGGCMREFKVLTTGE